MAGHSCCRVPLSHPEYMPCGTSCCCVINSFDSQKHQFPKSSMGEIQRGAVGIIPPVQVKMEKPKYYLGDLMKELKELNKHFRRYFKKKTVRRKR